MTTLHSGILGLMEEDLAPELSSKGAGKSYSRRITIDFRSILWAAHIAPLRYERGDPGGVVLRDAPSTILSVLFEPVLLVNGSLGGER
jgi:hypothetical protein